MTLTRRFGRLSSLGTKFADCLAMRSPERQTVHVTIVAASGETLDGLQAYLSLAGLGARGTRRLDNCGREPCSAIVFFPDEFPTREVIRELKRVGREQPTVLSLLVTREPQRYLEITNQDGQGLAPIVMPKPAWGWTILDAIRLAVAGLRRPAPSPSTE
jgi:hypothetical protein